MPDGRGTITAPLWRTTDAARVSHVRHFSDPTGHVVGSITIASAPARTGLPARCVIEHGEETPKGGRAGGQVFDPADPAGLRYFASILTRFHAAGWQQCAVTFNDEVTVRHPRGKFIVCLPPTFGGRP